MNEEFKFEVGQEVVYPLQGVGIVKAIEERSFKSNNKMYYNIYIESSDMTALVPFDKIASLGIRPIVSKEEAGKALSIVSEEDEPLQGDWKTRYQINHDLLKQGSVIDIATVVRALYHRSKVKELPVLERKLYESALRLLIAEISSSLGQNQKEIEKIIVNRLEPNLQGGWVDEDDAIMDDE